MSPRQTPDTTCDATPLHPGDQRPQRPSHPSTPDTKETKPMTDHECPHWINIRPRYEADERHGRQCHLHPEDHTTDEAGWIIHATLIPNGAETWVVRDDSVSVGYGPGTTCSDRAYEIRWVSPPAEMAHGAP